jgi:hypothetical protein
MVEQCLELEGSASDYNRIGCCLGDDLAAQRQAQTDGQQEPVSLSHWESWPDMGLRDRTQQLA